MVTPERVLAELEALAARLGIAVRSEPFGRGVLEGRGGLCRVNGKALIVMDASLRLPDRIAVLAGALAQLDLAGVTVAPAVRERIEAAGRSTRRRPARAATPKHARHPGLARARPTRR